MGEAEAEAAEGEEVDAVDAAAVAVAKDEEPAVHRKKEQMYHSTAGRMARAVIPVGSVNVQRKAINTRRHSNPKWMVRPFIVHYDKLGAVFVVFYIN